MFRYRLIRWAMNLIRMILRLHITVHGQENIPANHPYIVVLNHTSVADTPILLLAFPLLKWRFFAVEKWKYHPIYGPIMAWLGAIYIRRAEVDRNTLREAMKAIREGTVFGLAPEGMRSFTAEMMEARDGAAYLASRTKAPVVPVGLVNNDRLFSNAKKLQRTHVEVHIGEPFYLPDIGRRAKGPDLRAFTHLIMVRIAGLLPARYHGFYADSPALAALLRGEDPWPYCYQTINQ